MSRPRSLLLGISMPFGLHQSGKGDARQGFCPMSFVFCCNVSSALTHFPISVAIDLSNSDLTIFLKDLIVGAQLLH